MQAICKLVVLVLADLGDLETLQEFVKTEKHSDEHTDALT